MAGHAQPKITQLYDHSQNAITLAEVKRIEI
jgi:hypothetical protein